MQHHNPFAPRSYGKLEKITEHVHLFRNITNSSVIIGSRSVAVIDTQVNLPTAEKLLQLIRSVTDKPIEYVINTHYHWDHTNGNALFKKEGATVISSALTKDFMVTRSPRQKEFLAGRGFELGDDPFLPERTFDAEMTLDLGDMPLRLFFAGSAETEDATAVHIEREGIIAAGDTVMTGSFPIFGQPVWDEGLEGDGRWQATIGALMKLSPRHILPGHGPLAGAKEIELLLKIEDYFVAEVGAAVKRGMNISEILDDLEPRLPQWITSIPVVWGSPRYAILRVWRGLTKKSTDREPGWQRFKPSAVPSASGALTGRTCERLTTPEMYLSAAQQLREGGDMGLALSVLKRASSLFADDLRVQNVYADTLIHASRDIPSVLEKGDLFMIARRLWEEILAKEPGNKHALLSKGRYLTMMAFRGGDDPRPGMALLERVGEAEAEFYIGMGYRRLGDEAKAKEKFNEALKLDAGFMPARLALAV